MTLNRSKIIKDFKNKVAVFKNTITITTIKTILKLQIVSMTNSKKNYF